MSHFDRSRLYEVVAPQPHDEVAPQFWCTGEEWMEWEREQRSFMYLRRVLMATEGWKRKQPGQLTAWEGPGYDFEPYFVREKARMPVTLDIEEDPVPRVSRVEKKSITPPKPKLTVFQRVKSVVKRCVSGIASAITNPRSLCNLFAKEIPQRRPAMKSTTPEVRSFHVPGAWPDQSSPEAWQVKPKKKKSVSFSTAPKESCTVHVPCWINVTRDEWAATSVASY